MPPTQSLILAGATEGLSSAPGTRLPGRPEESAGSPKATLARSLPGTTHFGEPVLNSPDADLPVESLPQFEALYDQGRYVTCHALALERHGPIEGWRGGVRALVFGSRLALNLGRERLSHALALRADRRAHADPGASPAERASAALFHAYRVLGRRGPHAARLFLDRGRVGRAIATGGTPEVRASICALRAQIAAAFRDVDAAEDHWRQAQRTALLIQADRYAEALEASREALRLQPWHRPAVQYSAQALTLLGRDEEALALLAAALDPSVGALESPAVAAQLATLFAELERPEEVLRALDRCEALSALAEEEERQWLASRRAEALLQLGDLAGSAAAAEPLMAASFFYRQTAPRLREPGRQDARRVLHPVPFVRQHERTCAPATLAALTRFWNRPADQAAIAAEICYGGTFDHRRRRRPAAGNPAARRTHRSKRGAGSTRPLFDGSRGAGAGRLRGDRSRRTKRRLPGSPKHPPPGAGAPLPAKRRRVAHGTQDTTPARPGCRVVERSPVALPVFASAKTAGSIGVSCRVDGHRALWGRTGSGAAIQVVLQVIWPDLSGGL